MIHPRQTLADFTFRPPALSDLNFGLTLLVFDLMTEDQHCYGSFCSCKQKCDINDIIDIERVAPRGGSSPCVLTNAREKDIAMTPLVDRASDQDSVISEESHDSAQAGVKRLEAISSTWSKTGLYFAYLGYAIP